MASPAPEAPDAFTTVTDVDSEALEDRTVPTPEKPTPTTFPTPPTPGGSDYPCPPQQSFGHATDPAYAYDARLFSGAEFSRNGSTRELGIALKVGDRDCVQFVGSMLTGEMDNFTAEVLLPKEMRLISGNLTYAGPLRSGEDVVFEFVIQAVEVSGEFGAKMDLDIRNKGRPHPFPPFGLSFTIGT